MAMENLGEVGSENKVELRKKSPSLPTKVRMGFKLETELDGFKVGTNIFLLLCSCRLLSARFNDA